MSIFKPLAFLATFLALGQGVTVTINENYTLSYDLDGNERIIFEVQVQTQGFVGFGLSPNGGMNGADIVVGGIDSDGKPYFDDMHGVGNKAPVKDTSQDYTLISGSQNETHTILKFSRALTTCDKNKTNDLDITADTMRVIWSFGPTDTLGYHGVNRGVKSFQFLDPLVPPPDLSLLKTWEMRANTTMPPENTTYWCTIHKTPAMASKNHLVGFDAILESPEAFKHTHHLDVYKCRIPDGAPPTYFDPYVGMPGVDCYAPRTEFFPHKNCDYLQYGWAIGGQTTMFPDKLGFPLFPNEYYMLEVHYDNPDRLENQQFDVGLKLYHTEKLREIDAAYFMVNSVVSFSQMIPPSSSNFITTAHCAASCTEGFPEDGINVFNIFLHAHKSAKKMKVRHFRNGKELRWPIYDNNYDFNYQQNRPLRNEFKFLRGDHITIECTYDNTWKSGEPTIGGRATTEEMCMAMFFYYPMMTNIIECKSEMPIPELLSFLGIEAYELGEGEEDPTVTAPDKFRGKKFTTIVRDYFTWNSTTRENYQLKARTIPQNGYCFPGGSNYTGMFPQYDAEYTPPSPDCLSKNYSGRQEYSLAILLSAVVFSAFANIVA